MISIWTTSAPVMSGLFLPASIKSCMDGRWTIWRIACPRWPSRLAVETDMMAGILADTCQLSPEELRRRRAESVRSVKSTNGRISLERRAREAWDEWQD